MALDIQSQYGTMRIMHTQNTTSPRPTSPLDERAHVLLAVDNLERAIYKAEQLNDYEAADLLSLTSHLRTWALGKREIKPMDEGVRPGGLQL